MRVDPYYEQESGSETKANVKLKLILPRSERRFRVLLSTDEQDNQDPDTGTAAASSADEDSNVSFALRFIRKAKDRSGSKFDLGAKVRGGKGQAFFRWGAFVRRPFVARPRGVQVRLSTGHKAPAVAYRSTHSGLRRQGAL